jgi:hypothetical protein
MTSARSVVLGLAYVVNDTPRTCWDSGTDKSLPWPTRYVYVPVTLVPRSLKLGRNRPLLTAYEMTTWEICDPFSVRLLASPREQTTGKVMIFKCSVHLKHIRSCV